MTEPRLRAEVGCHLAFEVEDHAELALQIAPATSAGELETEELRVALDGRLLIARELLVDHGGRVHLVECGPGALTVDYRAVVRRAVSDGASAPTEAERLVALRASRYAQSDVLDAFANQELDAIERDGDLGQAIATWVFERLQYVLGSSGPLDTAVDTLLARQGVCRDFAHLTIALCRAVGVPARLVSVYAPGISPMDFHAVAEIAPAGSWEVVDATKLAPRQSLLRIATGRDAADTAFCTTIAGWAELVASTVDATIEGDLPLDDHSSAVALP